MNFDWLAPGIGLVLFLGAAAVYLRGSKDKGTIATLKENNAAQNEKIERITQDNKELKVRVKTLEDTNGVLQNTVNSSDLIRELGVLIAGLRSAVDNHHIQAMGGVAQIHDDLTAIKDTLEGNSS